MLLFENPLARFCLATPGPLLTAGPANAAPSRHVALAPLVFWSRLIQAAAVVLTLSAVLLLAPDLGERVFNLVYYQQLSGPVQAPAPVAGYIRFANGIIGAVMAGWMFMVIMLARGPFVAGQALAWRTIAYPLAGWYAVDTAFSAAHGVWGNVLLNTGTAVMFSIPLPASRKYFGTGP